MVLTTCEINTLSGPFLNFKDVSHYLVAKYIEPVNKENNAIKLVVRLF